ncbi:MAG: FAD-dependent thymidylate synthase, partial [Thermoleophilaceae bacterium]|nr:FAD-dependent thymidylate synthase [Thermoleophilaceae bacterium]
MSESFSEEERRQLAPYFSNADLPVFALSGMSETMKGAMFARYSRYSGSLRRMFLDEFAGEMPASTDAVFNDSEGDRAADLYKRIFLGYGDDSVAQLGGAHIACEFVSNVLTKVLQRGRLAAYLEQSTRYIPYDVPMPGGGYRYHRSDLLGPQFEHAMDTLFTTYSQLIPRVSEWVAEQYPAANGDDAAAHARAVKAKTFDLLRGLLPASSLSHVGIFASGQAYESLLLHLAASPLPEANHYGEMMLTELKKVIPSFVQRVERPERGGRWIDFLAAQRANGDQWAARLGIDMGASDNGPSVRLLSYQGDERRLATALLFEAGTLSEPEIAGAVDGLDEAQLDELVADLVGDRENRRHRPGRGFERLSYRFEIVSDYGAFRDLQRHRMLTCQWQTLSPQLGAEIPHEVDEAGVGNEFRAALEASHNEYDRLVDVGLAEHAPYALCLAYRIRYVLDLNAREAMQLIELRSGREGHPAYRAVAHAMWDEISRVHPRVAAAMTHVDRESEPRLERLSAEMRNQSR